MTGLLSVLDAVESFLAQRLGDRLEANTTLSAFTTFRIGGPARLLVKASTVDDLEVVADSLAFARQNFDRDIPVLTVGQGSNLLVSDDGFLGIVVHLAGTFSDIALEQSSNPGEKIIRAGGAVKLPVLARRCAAEGCGGVGWMVGVPGSVGGAVRMNAGGHGSDVAANIETASVFDLLAEPGGRLRNIEPAKLDLSYRSSALDETQVVVGAVFVGQKADAVELDAELTEIVRWRRANQPGGANCGSVFTNPSGLSAGKLIDDAGLRGFRLTPGATAQVSEKHGNFIQADQNATASDVWALIVHVRGVVFASHGVVLHPEVRTIGFDATLPTFP